MKPLPPKPSCEDVLDAFSVEAKPSGDTLARYLREYPQYAAELVDLSRELSRAAPVIERPLEAEDRAFIDHAWKRFRQTAALEEADLFASLTVEKAREIACRWGVPRHIITAFRERKVLVTSVSRGFLAELASALNTSLERLVAALSAPAAPALARNYKADSKPERPTQVTFEQLLIDAGVDADKRAKLIAGNGG